MSKPIVTITAMPPRTFVYYDWLVTGLALMAEQGKIELRYTERIWDKVLRSHPRVMDAFRRFAPAIEDIISPMDYVCLTARVEQGGKVATFALDIADAPFNYSLGLLETVDLYFKCQCPAVFDPQGFELSKLVRIPFHPDVFAFQKKIRPAMLGRPLGRGRNLKRNLRVLHEWESAVAANKDIKLFASFASDGGLAPRTDRSPLPAPHNYESETTLLARWGDKVQLPNLKREKIVEMMRAMNKPDVDARIWKSNNPAVKGPMLSRDDYTRYVGRSMFNVNISGCRRSLPFRVMDSFITGCAVATDTLAIRWYREFEKGVEVFEIGDLGYERPQDVDWNSVNQKLNGLYDWAGRNKENSRAVLDCYRKKWSPEAFAAHVVAECSKTIEAKP